MLLLNTSKLAAKQKMRWYGCPTLALWHAGPTAGEGHLQAAGQLPRRLPAPVHPAGGNLDKLVIKEDLEALKDLAQLLWQLAVLRNVASCCIDCLHHKATHALT
jgi:hypothetical protein